MDKNELSEEVKKSIEEMVDQAVAKFEEKIEKSDTEISSDEVKKTEEIVANSTQAIEDPTAQSTEVEKSVDKDTDRESNGGKDKIKSGTPQTEKQSMMKSEEEVEKSDCDDEVKEHEDKMHKKDMKKMKKSMEELSEHLMEDELEVIAAWREATAPAAQESVAKSGLAESNDNSEVLSKLDSLAKSLEAKDDLIKSLSEKVEKLSSQPAYDKRSIDNLEPVEKSEEASTSSNLTKSQVLDTMLDLQKSGKGITSYHIAEFEATGNISNASVRETVLNKLKSK